ncbi:hypothetical protein TRFO_01379 [Tritrichomonas foetus]|uniref:Uncharacterized protein n=1 Tax=Tritrichomonas foetus TaxID=1144522 RepID=A0A1J4K6X0_9EUKA|nr:hypothetical protein TRFO_01379 [Tritrichomonas foetus]|eukprot:OHT07217.1 hypothetical protein TRFO_01379 [Tritrichomonas foetus]
MSGATTTERCFCHCNNISIRNFSPILAPPTSHCSFLEGYPILHIHTNSVNISNQSQIHVQMTGPREAEISCLECSSILYVYASRKGAYCQFKTEKTAKRHGSYPSDTMLGNIKMECIPKSMRQLFTFEVDYLDKESSIFNSLQNPNHDAHSFNDNSPDFDVPFRALNLSDCEENDDYDLMFSSQSEPTVGSYAGIGVYLSNGNRLVNVV